MSEEKHESSETENKLLIKSGSGTDRISNLPADILSCIISYFTVRDAAVASVLSSGWKYHVSCASSMSQLSFDLCSMFQPHVDPSFVPMSNAGTCSPYKDLFVRGVNQFLQFYKGLPLRVFLVSFCLYQDSASDIDRWVYFATDMGVKQLHLHFTCSPCFKYGENILEHTNLYTLRSDVLSKGGVAKVQTLTLRSCLLGPGVINQFSSLIVLGLVFVTLSVFELENIFSCCSNLESVTLINCELSRNLRIPASLHRLKHLTVYSCWGGVEEINISATNLTRLELDSETINVCCAKAPNLKEIFFNALDEERMQYVFSQLANDFPLIEALSVFSPTNWVQCLPQQITTFSKVKQLDFFTPTLIKFDVYKIMVILKACPLLEKFHMVMLSYGKETSGSPTPHDCVHKYLKQVHLGGFYFKPSYIVLAVFMMDYAKALERMVIDPVFKISVGLNKWSYSTRFNWDRGERAKVCLRLMGHCKSSVIIVK